jgi:hypothetical protein
MARGLPILVFMCTHLPFFENPGETADKGGDHNDSQCAHMHTRASVHHPQQQQKRQ